MSTSTDDISDLEKYAIPDAVKQYYEEFDKHAKNNLAFYSSFLNLTKYTIIMIVIILVLMAIFLLYQSTYNFIFFKEKINFFIRII